jgi:hypothetical protein
LPVFDATRFKSAAAHATLIDARLGADRVLAILRLRL